MPDMITHYLFGKDAIEKMNEKNKKIVNLNRKYYDLGCNGPDAFFYYHVLPYKSKKNKLYIRNMGSYMHNNDINHMFKNMFDYLRDHYSSELHAYVLGFIMHYYADRNCHPYIYYFAGLSEVKEIYGYYHKLLEVHIDQMLLELFEGKTLKNFKLHSINAHTDDNLKIFFPMIQDVLEKTYHVHLDFKPYKDAWDEFYLVEKMAGSSKPYKKRLVEFVEKKTNQLPFFSTAVYAPDYKTFDVLNLKHQTWCDPCDEKAIYQDSFIDCYLRGVNQVNEMVEALDLYLENGDEGFLNLIRNRGFDTNHAEGIVQKYYSCMFEKGDK